MSFQNIIISFFLLSLSSAQDSTISFNIKNFFNEDKSWWKENNNYGKSSENYDININWLYKKRNFEIVFNLSNGYSKTQRISHVRYIGNINNKINNFFLGETYIKYSNNRGYFKFGKYYRDFSTYLNDDLSSGSTLISFNASPIPKIGYKTDFKIKKILFEGGFSHGWLNNDGYYIKAPFLHEKFIYLIKQNKFSKFGVGLVHEAVWGGGAPEKIKSYPSSIKDFLKVIISADGPYEPPHANALGNHLGIWDFYYTYHKTNNHYTLYYQHFFEDTSSLRFANGIDGLWGIEISNKDKRYNLLIEYLTSKNSQDDPPYQDDWYYWNYQYRLGWQYQSKIIGNTLFVQKDFKVREFNEAVVLGIIKNFKNYELTLKVNKIINYQSKLNYLAKFKRNINENTSVNLQLFNTFSSSSGAIEFQHTF